MTLFALLLLLTAFQDEEIREENLDTQSVGDRFTQAVSIFDSVQRSDSESMFQAIVEELEVKEELNEEERFLMTESLRYLGVINYPDGVEAWFEKLIRFDPSYQIPARDLPPKIVSVFDNLRANLVGSLVVSAQDAASGLYLRGARLFVNGRDAGPIDGPTRFYVFTGMNQFEVRRPNFEAYAEELEIDSTAEGFIRAQLNRTAAEFHLVTVPRDVTVRINGTVVGRTDQDPSDEYFSKLREMGIDRKDAGFLVVNGIEPGAYDVQFEKDCYKTLLGPRRVDEPKKVLLLPQQLEPARAALSVDTAGDAEGLVFLGTERVGFTPVENYEVCPGTYELRVRFTDGEFLKTVELTEDGHTKLTAEPLPSIAWYGLEDENEGTPPGDMNTWINSLTQWNVRSIDARDTTVVPVNPFPILFGAQEMTPENREALTRRLQADLYMAARVVRKKVVIRTVEVAMWSPLSKRIMIKTFDFREFTKFRDLVAEMDAEPKLTKPWLGIQVAALQDLEGCRVLEVSEKGPLAGQIQVGETIVSVNGSPLRNPRMLMDISGDVQLSTGDRNLTVTPPETIAEIPFDAEQGAPPAMLARLDKMARYHQDKQIRQAAKFNLARYQFFLGDVRDAYDTFSTMTLDADFGISQGTLFFYQGLCFRKLKLTGEATQAFRSVLQYPHATLFDAYGPKAAFWADAEMKNAGF